MKTIDELIGDKILDLAHFVLSKMVKPDLTFENVLEIDAKTIDMLKKKYEIEGIIIDVDDTLRTDDPTRTQTPPDDTLRKEMRNIPKCNKTWIESLRGKFKIIILSNGMDRGVEDYFKEQGIDYVGFALKPLKRNFRKACQKMGLRPEQVLVVGDSLFDDVYGGRRNRMWTGLIKDVDEGNEK